MKPGCLARILAIVCTATSLASSHAAPLSRVPNTTLNVPATPPVYGFKLVAITNTGGTAVTFSLPVGFASPPGETNRLFVIEKTGTIAVITNLAAPTRSVFLDLSTNKLFSQTATGEGGLVGFTFHPGYATNGYFYVFYLGTNTTRAATNQPHDNLARYSVDPANSNRALAGSELKLISQYDTINSHNAGDLHFGPDGYLYVSLGDEGSGGNVNGDPRTNSQHIAKNFYSALLRIDVDKRPSNLAPNSHPAVVTNGSGQANYAIPIDNPYVHTTLGGIWNGLFNGSNYSAFATNVRSEFYAVGFRNPWRFSFDPVSGRLLVGDVGLKDREEINDVVKGGNYGWAFREGTTNGTRHLETPPGFTSIPPIFEYGHVATNGNWLPQFSTNRGGTVIGGVFYHGDRISQLSGYYVFGDYDYGIIEPAGQPLWAFKYDGTNVSNFQLLLTAKQICAYGIDPANGDVLLACLTNVATAGMGAGFNSIFRLAYNTNTVSGTPPPPTLADTGAFSDLTALTPQPGIVPYSLNVPFWSDNAIKSRWFSLPDTNLTVGFDRDYNWSFPTGAVWIKHFELELTNGVPASRKRLETRLLVKNAGGIYGLTYRWGNSLSNATLVDEGGLDESFVINDGGGILRTQIWHYPSRNQCLQCHTAPGGFALGFNTPQLNRDFDYGGGTITNQLQALSDAGYFSAAVTAAHTLRALVPATNTAVSLEYRARSYFAANCRQCHQGVINYAAWDANITTPTALAGIVDGALVDNLGNTTNRVVKPGSLTHSVLFTRIAALGADHMPPLGTSVLDAQNIALLATWITNSLPGYQTFAQWQVNYAWANSGDADADADPDLDGAVNYLEYLTLTDPQNGTNFWQVGIQLAGNNVGITFPQIAGRGFEVQFSDSLIAPAWTPLDSPANAPYFSASNFVNTIWDSAASSSNRYYRVRVFEP